jgi:hypothetical protein
MQELAQSKTAVLGNGKSLPVAPESRPLNERWILSVRATFGRGMLAYFGHAKPCANLRAAPAGNCP